MEKLKSNLQNMVGVLVGVAFVCALLLAIFNKVTSGPVAEQAAKALQDGIKNVMQSDSVVVEGDTIVEKEFNGKVLSFVVHDTDKGVAIESIDPNAFGGNLKVLVGFPMTVRYSDIPFLKVLRLQDLEQRPLNGFLMRLQVI